MEICKSYRTMKGYNCHGRCAATKTMEICSCQGNRDNCTFYPEYRGQAKKILSTAEMWTKAQLDNKTYMCREYDMFYSKAKGIMINKTPDRIRYLDIMDSFDELMFAEWEQINVMTIEEVEEAYGIKVIR